MRGFIRFFYQSFNGFHMDSEQKNTVVTKQ